ncbi:XRE family transcriptional regulator [Sphaerisporangium album]|uniref:XRE family transcriptional regulator n=1 Tax=Sphaerisporangium album TaxID=509200 RepID=A0A367FTZ7_9ACTN|nr:helix-turn-helix transcriptional regulator [Sphaerisporangium album]RCG33177.1 XRE family transcriptional regulator [Sphaerisporangium album]
MQPADLRPVLHLDHPPELLKGVRFRPSSGGQHSHVVDTLAFFAAELRRLREEAGLTQEQLGTLINYSSAQVSAVENIRRNPKKDFAEGCDQALQTDGYFGRLWPLVRRAVHRPAVRSYFEAERVATSIKNFEPFNVPGLLQTPGYVQALMQVAGLEDFDDRVEAKISERLDRQTILQGKTSPGFFAVVDEAVLQRPVGGKAVMREQLEHLIKMAARPRIIIQVVPATVGAYPGVNGPVALLSLPGLSEVGYIENVLGGQIIDVPDDVAKLAYTFDTVRAEALSQKSSIDLIRRVLEKWA